MPAPSHFTGGRHSPSLGNTSQYAPESIGMHLPGLSPDSRMPFFSLLASQSSVSENLSTVLGSSGKRRWKDLLKVFQENPKCRRSPGGLWGSGKKGRFIIRASLEKLIT